MKNISKYEEFLAEGAVILDGCDSAIVGYSDDGLIIYSYQKLIEKFVSDGMTLCGAVEWFDYNVMGIKCNGSGFVILYNHEDI